MKRVWSRAPYFLLVPIDGYAPQTPHIPTRKNPNHESHQRLTAINNNDEITNEKTQLFKLLWRMHQHRTGPPHYPEITRKEITKLLETTRKTIEPS